MIKVHFQTMPQWIPLGGYQIGDKGYLCAPLHIHNKIVTEDLQIGRMVHYSAAQLKHPHPSICASIEI